MLREEVASVRSLVNWLSNKPLLWVGAGMSVAAGYPTTDGLVRELCAAMPDVAGCTARPFTEVVDLYKSRMGEQALAHFLNCQIGVTRQPVAIHKYIADLASQEHLSGVYTTNYDDLIERSLRNEGVDVLTQPGEENLGLPLSHPGRNRDFFLISKVHGDGQSWKKAILSGESYENYYKRHPWMKVQITRALCDHWVIFLGCSLQDPRLLSWLQELSNDEAARLNPWMCCISRDAWRRLETYNWNGLHVKALLDRANLTVALYDDHGMLPALWSEADKKFAPQKPRRTFLAEEWTEISRLRALTRIVIEAKPGADYFAPMELAERDLIPKAIKRDWDYLYLNAGRPILTVDTIPGTYTFTLREWTPPPPPGSKGLGYSVPSRSNPVSFEAKPGTYLFSHTQTREPRMILDIQFGRKRVYHLTFQRFEPWPILIEAGDYNTSACETIAEYFRKQQAVRT